MPFPMNVSFSYSANKAQLPGPVCLLTVKGSSLDEPITFASLHPDVGWLVLTLHLLF